jgi:hypothetical protein
MRTKTPNNTQKVKRKARAPVKKRTRDREKVVRLIIPRNFLPWYDELNDSLDFTARNFPKDAMDKIIAFGDYEIEEISSKRLRLIQLKPKRTSGDAGIEESSESK